MDKSSKLEWYRDLLRILVNKELAVRYKGSVLGFFWSVLNPLANAYTFYVVFGILLRMDVPHFIVVLLAALFPWQSFNNSVMESTYSFLANASLVKKLNFPRAAIPLVVNLQNYVHLLLSLPIFLLFMLSEDMLPSVLWLWGIPLLLLLTMMTSYGLSLFFGTLNVFFRDLTHLVSIIMQVAFFSTPIMYVMTFVPEQYLWVFKANPVSPLFICWRSLLAEGVMDEIWLLPAIGYAVLFLVLGLLTFRLLQSRFAEIL